MEDTPKKSWGGARSGSGPKVTRPKQSVSVSLCVDNIEWLDKHGYRSQMLNRLVDAARAAENPTDAGQ